MNKILIGFCCFMLSMMVIMGFIHSWVSGLLRLAVLGVATALLLRLLQKNEDWQSKVFLALGITSLAFLLSVGADFILPHS